MAAANGISSRRLTNTRHPRMGFDAADSMSVGHSEDVKVEVWVSPCPVDSLPCICFCACRSDVYPIRLPRVYPGHSGITRTIYSDLPKTNLRHNKLTVNPQARLHIHRMHPSQDSNPLSRIPLRLMAPRYPPPQFPSVSKKSPNQTPLT